MYATEDNTERVEKGCEERNRKSSPLSYGDTGRESDNRAVMIATTKRRKEGFIQTARGIRRES